MSDRTPSPMFPLGSVLLPTMLLPLHVFEDRYRRLVEDVLDGDQTFGVTMIERGSEVGGDDVRAMVGCRARILEAEQQADGRWHLIAVGTDRIAVDEWLPDDPYPRAVVSHLPDVDGDAVDAIDDPRWLELDSAFRTLLQLVASVMASPVPVDIELSDDPAVATFQMAAVAPLGALDRYRVLRADTADRRREALLEAFEDATVLVNDASSN
ncbi:MAG: LON peptidase substrate-binding domain-containing protein [Acidimicrobiales bacterium]|mgnify:CR=1 FL=1